MQNIRKRYASDCSSSNLLDDERHHDTDTLAAVALIGGAIGAKQDKNKMSREDADFGALLLRAKWAGTHNEMAPAVILPLLAQWREMVRKKAKRRGWVNSSDAVAHHAFWYWMYDTCPNCNGLGASVIDKNTPVLNKVCGVCNGSKKKRFDYDDLNEMVIFCVGWLDRLERIASSASSRKLGQQDCLSQEERP